MDLNTVSEILRPRQIDATTGWRPGDAWLAGGTWLFSEPQPEVTRLIDLTDLGWPALTITERGLEIAATCTIAELDAFQAPADWSAAPLIGQCCRSFLASFKIWNVATVGGNLCLGLPAGPMISLGLALDGICTMLGPDGATREMAVTDFVGGPLVNALRQGECLRSLTLPMAALRRRFAFRRQSLTPLGRSGVLLIGTVDESGAFALAVTASVRRPLSLAFPSLPTAAGLADRIAAEIPDDLYYDDVHGAPAWRRHLTGVFAEEIRAELSGEAA
ncbi:FAD-binding molybdopterin dehydrogenase [Phreatobacter aquaticus]|uniref:FAD-binding molybdopterin dehydrogenase n=1 Tax=Phreatobacter aquaticus TaxID=2570229 RepID=A0A4D7QLX4_9HYPH|nr:FAD binding domain-containing protein [Phreatobacter aquaticus]QCK86117.1 FAD-binding molybdopterin dehydrogenase [Phreatobacter aquaticus]